MSPSASFPKLMFVFFVMTLTCSCKNNSNNFQVYKTLDEGLIKSNRFLNTQTSFVHFVLENKIYEPTTSVKAGIWFPKTEKLRQHSSDLFQHIDSLRIYLLKSIGYEKDNNQLYKTSNTVIVNKVFIKEKEAENLYERLEKFKQNILDIDPLIKTEFENSIQVLSPNSDSLMSKKGFIQTYFTDICLPASLAILSQLQNNVRITENRICNFCNQQVTAGDFFKIRFPLISQNSTHFKTGEILEILAGIGNFEGAFTNISINKEDIRLGDSGFARHRIKVLGKAGKYSLPVTIAYLDENNKMVTKTQTVSYIIDQ
jgi:hypothetical protein